ncbi:MAG: T9SS type A sorting domain-containing protein, partial [Lewinella sp.]
YALFTGTNELNASGRALAILAEEVLDGMVATDSDDKVRTFATQSADGELLTVFLLNKATEVSATHLTINGFVDMAIGSRSVFSGPSITGVETTYQNEEAVLIDGNTVEMELPATSLTVLRFDRAQVGTTSLPVSLIDFVGTSMETGILLEWSAWEEGDFAGYGIERSSDDQDWTALDFVAAALPEALAVYQYTDESGTSGYYRLRLEETDGTFRYSETIRLMGEVAALPAYPNPTRGPVYLSPNFAGLSFRVVSTSGRTVRSGKVPVSGRVSLGGLPGGIYHLVLEDTAQFRVVKR